MTLTPNNTYVHVNQSVQFTATVLNSTNIAVTWSLSGAGCSGTTCGTISSSGLYTAPASVSSPNTVTVKATSAADTSKSASATITILEAVVVSNEWAWVSGSDIANQAGAYGNKGIAAPSNVPAPRDGAISWLDPQGNLWLFGGLSSYGFNDLWKYDGTNWTWISGSNMGNQAGAYGTKGTAAPSNVPGAREAAVSWTDSQGNLWLFGGVGSVSAGNFGELNDLWKYDGTNWTWISGSNTLYQAGVYGTKGTADSSNVPGARSGAVSWIDPSGKFWLFGGSGYDSVGMSSVLSDLWKFDPTTLEWTWVSGSNTINQAGTYGTKGIPDSSNVPGARAGAVSWIDSSGNLWLFGGFSYGLGGREESLNDLWKYDPTALEWTWVSGSNTMNQAGSYGIKGTADSSNVPGARSGAVSWLDPQGNLWLFGGKYYAGGSNGHHNDLWKYDPTTLEWTWVSGSNTINQAGLYGSKGTPHSSSVPGARAGAVSWLDSQGNLWLFGGWGYDSVPAGYGGFLNDLWQFIR